MALREHYLHQLRELERELQQLATMADDAIKRAMWAFRQGATGEAGAIIRNDDEIDSTTDALVHHALTIIATQGPVASDLRLINAYIQCAGELERIADYAEGIARIVVRMADLPRLSFDPILSEMADVARRMLHDALDALSRHDPQIGPLLKQRDNQVDTAYERLFATITQQMQDRPDQVLQGTYTLWVGHNLERIADRATNIGEYVVYIVHGNHP